MGGNNRIERIIDTHTHTDTAVRYVAMEGIYRYNRYSPVGV